MSIEIIVANVPQNFSYVICLRKSPYLNCFFPNKRVTPLENHINRSDERIPENDCMDERAAIVDKGYYITREMTKTNSGMAWTNSQIAFVTISHIGWKRCVTSQSFSFLQMKEEIIKMKPISTRRIDLLFSPLLFCQA